MSSPESNLRLLLRTASAIQQEVDSVGLGRDPKSMDSSIEDWTARFDQLVTADTLRDTSRQLFTDGHFARSVEEAFKCLNNEVKRLSCVSDLDGASLMRRVFSAQKPVIKINDFESESEKKEQQGYMDIYAGVMTGIRNPRAHEHKLEDSPESALELLVLANHLMRKLEVPIDSE